MGPEVELVSCDLLREGAPIEPVPPVTHWKPDAVVRAAAAALPLEWAVNFCIFIQSLHKVFRPVHYFLVDFILNIHLNHNNKVVTCL